MYLLENNRSGELEWGVNLDRILDMYRNYETLNMWPILERCPTGISFHFIKAERSTFR